MEVQTKIGNIIIDSSEIWIGDVLFDKTDYNSEFMKMLVELSKNTPNEPTNESDKNKSL